MNSKLREILYKCEQLKSDEFDYTIELDNNNNNIFTVYWNKYYICKMLFRKSNQISYLDEQCPIELFDMYTEEYIDYNMIYQGLSQIKEKLKELKKIFEK
jgi:hypothetical protein